MSKPTDTGDADSKGTIQRDSSHLDVVDLATGRWATFDTPSRSRSTQPFGQVSFPTRAGIAPFNDAEVILANSDFLLLANDTESFIGYRLSTYSSTCRPTRPPTPATCSATDHPFPVSGSATAVSSSRSVPRGHYR